MATSTFAKLSLSHVPKISGAAQRRAAVSAAPQASSSLTFSSRSQLAKFKGKLHSQKSSRSVRARHLKSITAAEAGDKTAVVFGATGYIGKFVVNELQARGYRTVAYSRSKSGIGGKKTEDDVKADFPGVDVCFGEVSSKEAILEALPEKVDLVFSCMASRTGGIKDSWDIDYQATLNCLDAARAKGAEQFVLLSAICVQKPTLTFQKAKLKFEAALMEAGDIKYSIVRPTAFFKSLGGQVKSASGGGPYVMFGDGCLAACKPISEKDLASYMVNCVEQEELQNKVLPIGGPGEAMTALAQGQLLFKLLGKEEKFVKVPIEVMDTVIKVFDFFGGFFPNIADAGEFGKIGRYYAAESMLVMDENGEYQAELTPSYGEDTLEAFFQRCIDEGMEGQELGDASVF